MRYGSARTPTPSAARRSGLLNSLRRVVLTAALFALGASLAFGFPEGAPWDSADPSAVEHCASCHWAYEPVNDSPALRLEGLPKVIIAGSSYALTLTLEDRDALASGFQVIARVNGAVAGRIEGDVELTESALHGTAVRSTSPQATPSGIARWSLTWRAPRVSEGTVQFLLAASAANDDDSPLGDRIHYRQISVPIRLPARDPETSPTQALPPAPSRTRRD